MADNIGFGFVFKFDFYPVADFHGRLNEVVGINFGQINHDFGVGRFPTGCFGSSGAIILQKGCHKG